MQLPDSLRTPALDLGLGVLSNAVFAFLGFLIGRCFPWRRVKVLGFKKTDFNPGGQLHKFSFVIKGKKPPGESRLSIEWKGGPETFAKWDEKPNPVDNNQMLGFRAELVPDTYSLRLLPGQPYKVPIVWERDDQLAVFCGWSFDPHQRHGRREVTQDTVLMLTLRGEADLHWSKSFPVWKILGRERPEHPAPLS